MDIRYINPFMASVRDVFRTMANVEVQILKPRVRTDERRLPGVSGVIGLSGDVTGACVLCLPSEVACKLASAFSGEEMTESHPDFADAIGELANMVAGGAKSQLGGLAVSISLPSVVIGDPHEVGVTGLPSDTPRVVIPCQTEMGQFQVEVAMIVTKNPARKGDRTTNTAGATS